MSNFGGFPFFGGAPQPPPQQQHPGGPGAPAPGAQPGQIDPALLQSLYPQAFQALALQQQLQLQAMGKAAAAGVAQQQHQQGAQQQQQQAAQQQMHIYQAALAAASFPSGADPMGHPLLQQFHQQQQLMGHLQAQQQLQQQQQQQHLHSRDKGADMYDDDYEDDDEEYEDDEAPRKRRKAKKPVGVQPPKPKGAPRNYVVCKDCPQCKLKVGNNCFPSADHELMTERGFMSLQQVQAHLAQHDTLNFACFVDGALEYRPVGAAALTVAEGSHRLIDMTAAAPSKGADGVVQLQGANSVSLAPTDNHRMWVRLGGDAEWGVRTAAEVFSAGAKDATASVQFNAKFDLGLRSAQEQLPFAAALGLTSEGEIDAFIQLYGYWLGAGSLDLSARCVSFGPVKQADRALLDGLFARLFSAQVSSDYGVTAAAWVDFFAAQGVMSGRSSEIPSEGAAPVAERFGSWARTLSSRRVRLLLAGLCAANGQQIDAKASAMICTSSLRFRDELLQLALHAAYSAIFSAVGAGWSVELTDSVDSSMPQLNVSAECKEEVRSCTVWCVTVPTEEQLIMVRRVLSRDSTGAALVASRPVVVGNTRICRGCGHVFSNVKQHSHMHSHMMHAPAPTVNPDGSPIEARKSTRKRTKHNPQNSFDYLDKDEAAHLQIALQNSLVEVKTGDLSQVKDAPEYRPTLEEWKDPMAYVEKIRQEAENFGIAKIIPPAGWAPPYALKDDFKFPTRLQHIHRLTEAVGFEAGRHYTPAEYEKMANEFKEKWVRERNEKTGAVGQPSEEEIEQAYWKYVETGQPPIEVEYGNDISNVVAGGHGAFQPAGDEIDPSLYAGAPTWNLNLLPTASGSVLKSLPQSIQGITQPWLYMGMLFATFAWHNEDDYLYSMNYMHKGAPKIWYSIPAKKAQSFEKVLQRTLAQLMYEEPDLHLKLVTMLPPALLHSHQVPVFRCVQEPGTFIVTMPKALHGGLSLGFNVAEAVNFATDNWFQYGREAMGKYKKYQRGSVLSYAQLLFDCILNSRWKFNIDILRDELLNLYEVELRGRRLCRDFGVTKKQRLQLENFEPGQELECSKCRIPLYLSFVGCPCILDHMHLIAPPRVRLPDEPAQQQQQDQDQQQQQQHQQEQDHLHGESGGAAAHDHGHEHQHQHQHAHPHHQQHEGPSPLFNPNDPNAPHDHHLQQLDGGDQQQQQQQQQQQGQQGPEGEASAEAGAEAAAPAPPVERYTSLCMCECNHQIFCLDHIRQAKSALNTDYGGQMPVLFFRHVLPELVAMDEILALAPTEDELAGKVTATQLLKERTANIELDKDELPPTPPPPSAQEFVPIEAAPAAAAAAAAPVVAPKVKKERTRRVRHDSDDDEDFELNPNADQDDEDSDDDNPPITLRTHQYHHSAYVPIHHPSMLLPHNTFHAAAAPIMPRSQPRRSARDTGREDLKDGAYVNLDLVELDEVPGMEDDDDESRRQLSAIDINPHVRQALSAIVEAIAEVSSMKVDDEPQGMELDAHAHAAQQAAAHAQIAAQQQAHAQVLQQAAQLGMHPAAFIQMQQQMQASQQAAMLQQQRALQMHAAQQQQIQQQQHP